MDGLSFHADDDVSGFHAGSLGRAVRGYVPNACAALEFAARLAALHPHPEVGAAHPPLRYEREDDAAERARDGDGEAYALRAADDSRVDTDDPGRGVGQRAARVGRVDRRVGLDHVLYKPSALAPNGTPEGADDTSGHAPLEAERVPYSDDELADYEIPRVAQRGDRRLLLGLEAHDGEVARWIVAKHLGLCRGPVRERDLYISAGVPRPAAAQAAHDVAVGYGGGRVALDTDYHSAPAAASVGQADRDHRRLQPLRYVPYRPRIGVQLRVLEPRTG